MKTSIASRSRQASIAAEPRHRVDGRRAGIARGRADDGHALATRFQDMVEHAAEYLHGVIFEGQGRAMEQFHQPQSLIQLL